MISDQLGDTMEEVRSVLDSLEEGSTEWVLMSVVHGQLSNAHSLVHEVNRLRLGQLVNGKKH